MNMFQYRSMTSAIRSISEVLTDFQTTLPRSAGEMVSVESIVEAFHERGFGLLLLIFAIPAAIPVPGVHALIASPLLFLTAQQVMGRHTVWMPQWLLRQTISRDFMLALLNRFIPVMRRLEVFTKPRLESLTTRRAQQITGTFGLFMAIAICLPIPLLNTVPSIGLATMAIGVLMRDGIAVIAGIALGVGWIVTLVGAVIVLGPDGIDLVKDFIYSMLS